jgi:hypothetical protein
VLPIWRSGIGLTEIDVDDVAHHLTLKSPPAASAVIAATEQKQNQHNDD